MKKIVPACILLVAGAHIPYLTKSATQFEIAPVGSGITMPGSCYDLLDEHNFDTHHSNANYQGYCFLGVQI